MRSDRLGRAGGQQAEERAGVTVGMARILWCGFVMLTFGAINYVDIYDGLWHIFKTNVFDGKHQVL
jgi:hypothetical protein